jgi:precorrin-2 dehydrogenase/sirohydrochlorin ferrochelatase
VFPIVLNLAGRLVVVVGGGAVGLRKLSVLLECGAAVRIIEPNPVADLPAGVVHVAEAYQPEHLAGATLVFACATPEVNARVVVDGRAR